MKGLFETCWGGLKKAAGFVNDHKSTVAVFAIMALGMSSAFAADPVTLPDTGVDIAAYATAAITALGGVVAVCVAGVIGFVLVKWGVKWVKGIGR